jgi:hypothetical protein
MKKTLLLFFGSINTAAFCQHYELGLGLNAYSSLRNNSTTSETGSYSKTKRTYSSNPVLTFNFVNNRNTDFFIHAGYFYEPSKTDEKSGSNFSTSYASYTYGNTLAQSVFIRPGIGKRYNFEKLHFISAVNIPFQYIFYNHANSTFSEYNNGGQSSYSSYYADKAAPTFNIGLSLQQSFYYKILKNFMAGMDLNMTLNCNVINGTETRSQGYSDNGNPSIIEDQTIKYRFQTFTQLLFRPVISIKYILPAKNAGLPGT